MINHIIIVIIIHEFSSRAQSSSQGQNKIEGNNSSNPCTADHGVPGKEARIL